MDDSILYKYIKGTLTEEEKTALLAWLKESSENERILFEAEAVWKARRWTNREQVEAGTAVSLANLNKRIDTFERKATRVRLWKWTSVVAAVLVCLVVSTIFLVRQQEPDLITEVNAENADIVRRITLPDGTQVWLAAETRLSYPESFDANERRVSLDGEAFFDVIKDPDCPFVVHTEHQDIRVLGTSFSINTRAGERYTETLLMHGSVQLEADAAPLAVLRPGQQALYSPVDGTIEINEVDVNSLTSWRFGLVSLTHVSIEEIVAHLEKTYEISIAMDTTGISNKKYNFSFKRDKGAATALEQLSYVTGKTARILP